MKSAIEIFSQLGDLLANFGSEEVSRRVIEQAEQQNEWFTQEDVVRAIDAIRCQMLDSERLREWLSAYNLPCPTPKRLGIVMAGNIPAVGFFDMLCVVASGHQALVKLSSKDRVLMRHLISLLCSIEPEIPIYEWDGVEAMDAVIATGSDSANLHFRSLYGEIPRLLRGSRHSVAVLTSNESEEQLQGLSHDIFSYSGLGCRSVSLIFAPQGMSIPLHLPDVCRGYRNNYLRTKALLTMHGESFADLGSAVMVECEPSFPNEISRINIARYDSLSEVEQWLAHHSEQLQCVVSEADIAHAVPLGMAQYPRLNDYADNVDVMIFLLSLQTT